MPDILKGETIVYFGPDRWTGLWRNRQQLMSRFARHNNVWYVEPVTVIRHLIPDGRARRAAGRRHRNRLSTRDASGVNVFHSPWWLPVTGRDPLKRFSLRLYLRVLSLAAGLGKQQPIVWVSRPSMIDYVERLPAKLTIYHVVDEYSGYGFKSERGKAEVLKRESRLLHRVDAAIVVTRTLLDSKSPHNPNTFLVPNAVDFHAYAEDETGVPSDMIDIPGPIIGYSGLIAARLDLDLVEAVAASRPDWSFVFVGFVRETRCEDSVERLRALPNVHFIEQKPAQDTPAYVKRFDIGMIPYALNLRAQHASPLKLYEYAAASKPIVATDFAAARDFDGHIEIVRDRDGFVAACERVLAAGQDSPTVVENRRFAANNTWDVRIEQVTGIMQRCMRTR